MTNTPSCSNLKRVHVDAMLRIAALVSAISLLTACSCGDIVVKTDLNESYVVKDSAVTKIESPLDREIEYSKRNVERTKKLVLDRYGERRRCSRSSLSQAQCNKIWAPSISGQRKSVAGLEADLKTLQEAARSKDAWIKQVKYRPIFIDLNGNKSAMGYVTLTCLNPDVKKWDASRLFQALDGRLESIDTRKAYYSAGLKVCRKYAYKDGGVFAYHEAK